MTMELTLNNFYKLLNRTQIFGLTNICLLLLFVFVRLHEEIDSRKYAAPVDLTMPKSNNYLSNVTKLDTDTEM